MSGGAAELLQDGEVTLSVDSPSGTGRVARITIDRPHVRNALSRSAMRGFAEALERIDDEVSVVVVTGAGDRAFISGGDLKELGALTRHGDAMEMAAMMRRVLDRLATLPALTIAAINGHALGGGAEVAVACDIRLAADRAHLAFNQSQLAITPAWGGAERLVGLVGRSRALELMLTPRRLTAAEAESVGLVNEVVPVDAFVLRVAEIAASVAALPAEVVRSLKKLASDVEPAVSPATAADALSAFASSWVNEAHWAAVSGRVPIPPLTG